MWIVTPSNEAHHNLGVDEDARMKANTYAYGIVMALEVVGIRTRLIACQYEGKPAWAIVKDRSVNEQVAIVTC